MSTIVSGAQLIQSLLGTFEVGETATWTLIRLIASLSVAPLDPSTASGSMTMDWGFGVASQDAFVAAAVPDPDTASDHPPRGWIQRGQLLVRDSVSAVEATLDRRIDLDNHAKRKVDRGEVYFVVDNNLQDGTSFSILISGLIRCLYAL